MPRHCGTRPSVGGKREPEGQAVGAAFFGYFLLLEIKSNSPGAKRAAKAFSMISPKTKDQL
jgi:hypothetical protein